MKRTNLNPEDELLTVDEYLAELPDLVKDKQFIKYAIFLYKGDALTEAEEDVMYELNKKYINYITGILNTKEDTLAAMPEKTRDEFYEWEEGYQRTLPVMSNPDVKEVDGKLVKNTLKDYDVVDWNTCTDNDYAADKRQYICIPQAEPKEDVDKYYKSNLMYFKNVAMPFFYEYVKAMNFTIDSTELHGFAYHFGRAKWKEYFTFKYIGLGILIFIGAMIMRSCN